MIAHSLPAAGSPVAEIAARPKRWVSPSRRDRIADAVPEPRRSCGEHTARMFTAALVDFFLRWPGAYCTWARNDAIADALGLRGPEAVAYRLELAERFGLIRRFSSVKKFLHWLEMEGGPVYGLERPKNLRVATRVIVVLGALPEPIITPPVYGPLGLGEPSAEAILPPPQEEFCHHGGGDFATAHPIGSSEENERMERSIDRSFSLVTEDQSGQARSAVVTDPWDTLPEAERDRRLDEAARAHPLLRGMASILRAHAVEQLRLDRPELFVDAPLELPLAGSPPAPPPSPPVSQGKPRRGSAAAQKPNETPPRRYDPWAEQLIVDLTRLVTTHGPTDREWRIANLAECFTRLMVDPEGLTLYRSLIYQAATGQIPVDLIADAVRYATDPGRRSRGRSFSWFVSHKRPSYAAQMKKATTTSLAKD